MNFGLKTIGRLLRIFRKSEDGGPTIEFVLMFMPFMLLTVSAFELGLLMTRHVMLERGLDIAVREVRLNTSTPVTEAQLKSMVCNAAVIIPNCTSQVRLEMVVVDMMQLNAMEDSTIPRTASCVDQSQPFLPARNFQTGMPNQMMIVRACARLVPMLPETALGYFLSQIDGGYYRLISTSSFVMEPL